MTDATNRTWGIGEMCADFGVTPRTLRFYESRELLFPIREGQRRLFTSRDRARLKLILQGKRFGFSLGEIRELLELYEPGPGQVRQLTATLKHATRRLAEMEAQRAELDVAIVELRAQMTEVDRLIAERARSHAAE